MNLYTLYFYGSQVSRTDGETIGEADEAGKHISRSISFFLCLALILPGEDF